MAMISIAGMARSYGARLSSFVVPACGDGVWPCRQKSNTPPLVSITRLTMHQLPCHIVGPGQQKPPHRYFLFILLK
jgi:hypothetical protein